MFLLKTHIEGNKRNTLLNSCEDNAFMLRVSPDTVSLCQGNHVNRRPQNSEEATIVKNKTLIQWIYGKCNFTIFHPSLLMQPCFIYLVSEPESLGTFKCNKAQNVSYTECISANRAF